MKRIILTLILALAAPSGWAAEKLPLETISAYFNAITTAQSRFSQINDDGSLSTGVIYIHRPGRMRFEYDPPEAAVVIAGAGAVVIHDPKSNEPPETYPLKRTPLWIILARKVDLDQAKMVVGHRFDGTATIVRALDPEHPEYGSIDLKFTGNPVALTEWVINDGNGGQTTVVLDGLQTGGQFSSDLFAIEMETGSSGR
ncbi:MAG: outer membrane lipoprotein carrier protein LolA [Rhodobacteraceae bacterium]|nr:outer membrane lipoprotein carrier protein LolA [Paracoccaceae bacterium]